MCPIRCTGIVPALIEACRAGYMSKEEATLPGGVALLLNFECRSEASSKKAWETFQAKPHNAFEKLQAE